MNEATRVLVCDDEAQILRALRVILRDAGYEAVTAATGEGGARPRLDEAPGGRDPRPDAS